MWTQPKTSNNRTRKWPWSTCRLTTLSAAPRTSQLSLTSRVKAVATTSRSSRPPIVPLKGTLTRWRLPSDNTTQAWYPHWIRRLVDLLDPLEWIFKSRLCTRSVAVNNIRTTSHMTPGKDSHHTLHEALSPTRPSPARAFLATIRKGPLKSSFQWNHEML